MLPAPLLKNEAERLQALHSLNVLFTPAEERFDRITRLAARTLGTSIATVTLIADKCQWFKSAEGLTSQETSRDIALCAHALQKRETLVVEDASKDPRFSDNPLVTGAPNIRAYAGHPLYVDDKNCVGTLCVIDPTPRQFTEEQLDTLRDLAALVETELRHNQMGETQLRLIAEKDELERRASVDDLTRLWNRRAIIEILDREFIRSRRGVCFSLVMIDIDHFKKINDTYGHPVGDKVIKEIAHRLRQAVREIDAVGRYGGEEFMVVLTDCNAGTAHIVANRILNMVNNKPFDITGAKLPVTVSIGLSSSHSSLKDTAQIIKQSDDALYRAKNKGRNRIEIQIT
jgi:diguanylate cyclase (GGDEF)-like protein